jgi:hypothetical protein
LSRYVTAENAEGAENNPSNCPSAISAISAVEYQYSNSCIFPVRLVSRIETAKELTVEARLKGRAFKYNERFLEFIKLFAQIGSDSRIFPKTCHTCGTVYRSFPQYIHNTSPTAHCLEEYGNSVDANFTMQYRNCDCGSTLTIAFTKETYPLLDRFWEMIGKESKETGKPVQEVVTEFREQCNRYVVEQEQS